MDNWWIWPDITKFDFLLLGVRHRRRIYQDFLILAFFMLPSILKNIINIHSKIALSLRRHAFLFLFGAKQGPEFIFEIIALPPVQMLFLNAPLDFRHNPSAAVPLLSFFADLMFQIAFGFQHNILE